jgi:signal transduction histidine kinase
MFDIIGKFMGPSDFLPHGFCIGWWSPLVSTFIASDALIALSYFSMPLVLLHFSRRRHDFPYPWLLWLFAAFIMACGSTHLLDVVVLWYPLYGLSALAKAVTAAVSVVTAVVLWPLIPHALKLPSAAQLRLANDALQAKIAEHKRMEEALRLRSAELMAANQELEAFAYAVSHDLRAPLRAMSGFTKILTDDFADEITPAARECIDHIAQASSNMGDLLEGLLALSRVTRGEINREPVDLSLIGERIREEFELAEPARSVTWEIEPGLVVQGDRRMLESIMRNLLGNAWKYTALTAAPVIRVCSRLSEGERYVCVEDNGAGFDMAHAKDLFQPFRRLHRLDEFPGLGIGLATVLRVLNRHGGTIKAEAAPQRGASFYFKLPEPEQGLSQ